MGLIARAAVAALLLGLSFAASAASIWFSSNDSLYRLDPSSNQTVLVAAPGTTQALAVSPKDGSAWVLVASRLLNYNESGVPQVDLDLKTLGLQNPSSLTLDPYDATLWLFDGKALLRLGAAGQALNTWQAPGVVRTLALGVDENVWVLGNKQVWRFDSQGTILASQDLTGLLKEEPKFLAVDSLGDAAAARKRNADAMVALLAAYPELRKPFHGVWVFAEAAGQNPFVTEQPMSEIH